MAKLSRADVTIGDADQRRVATQPSEKTVHNVSFSRALAAPKP
jgi:uncharacterized membrane protein